MSVVTSTFTNDSIARIEMDNAENGNTSNNTDSDDDIIPIMVRFWITLPVLIPSVICSIFLLVHLLGAPASRRALHNHLIIILLLLSLLYILCRLMFSLIYYQLGVVWPAAPTFCKFLIFIDFGTYSSALIFMAWASIERHLLVFHKHIFVTHIKRRIWHYCPLYGISLYLIIYYMYFMFFYPCEYQLDYTLEACGDWPCFLNNKAHAIFHNLVHGMIPVLLIVLFSFGLFIRVINHKRRLHQPLPWRKQRTMVIQLLAISTLYSCTNLPMMTIAVMRQMGLYHAGPEAGTILFFLSSYVIMLFPFVILRLLPTVWSRFCMVVFRQQQTQARRSSTGTGAYL
jgi:hypothetical protein